MGDKITAVLQAAKAWHLDQRKPRCADSAYHNDWIDLTHALNEACRAMWPEKGERDDDA